MAKIKTTRNGNIKITMTQAQFDLVHAIIGHTRLGTTGNANIISDLAIEMSNYAGDADYDLIKFSIEDDNGSKTTIENVVIETD